MDIETIVFDGTELDNSKWKALISTYLETAKTFEIHCWNEEVEEMRLAQLYGVFKESDWKYGKIIFGEVTALFRNGILSLPKPLDTEIYNKMTPFFSVFLDNGFSSEHYGTENNIFFTTK